MWPLRRGQRWEFIVDNGAECRLQAARCRRMAAAITALDDPAIAALLELAREWEEKAAEADANTGNSIGNADENKKL